MNIAWDVRYETTGGQGRKRIAKHGEVGTVPLRAVAALLLLGDIAYAMLSGNWGIGALVFGLGAVVLGLDRLRVAQRRPDRAIGWVLILSGAFVVVDAMIRMVVGGA